MCTACRFALGSSAVAAVTALLCAAQVKGNGYVFGAYIHCAWSAPDAKNTVADPAGRSFLFSLVNASGKAARFGLRDKDRAIQFGAGISFGADKYEEGKATGYPNCILMVKGQAADRKDANGANPLTSNKAYQTDDDEVRDESFLTGQQDFAAAEIEVYQL